MTENEGGERREVTSPLPTYESLVHYLIVRREPTGFEVPHTFFRCGEGVLPVFCAREAARSFIDSGALGEEWYVRGFSVGEMISLLFALRERVAWVLFSPLPGHLLIEDALSHQTSRDNFIASLIVR
ncbi:MAG TPA: hypothetical protein VFY54_22330 [Rubrobacter sp.]|nr:hypothetical protein [Rubrobacter sp.]